MENRDSEVIKKLNQYRGVFALLIVIGHAMAPNTDSILSVMLVRTQFLLVSYFFFVSAYGMVFSFYHKQNYFKGFVRKKIGYLVMVSIVLYIAALIAEILFWNTNFYVASEIWLYPKKFVSATNWYIWELIVWYVVFRLVYLLKKRELRCLFLGVISVVLFCFFFLMRFEPCWYASLVGFPIGIIMSEYNELPMFKKEYAKIRIPCIFVCMIIGGSAIMFSNDSLIGALLRNFACFSVILFIVEVSKWLLFDNSFFAFFNRHSAEIYLVQFPLLNFTSRFTNVYSRTVIVLILTVLLAVALHEICIRMKRSLNARG